MAWRKCVSCHHCVPYCRYRSITDRDTDRDTHTNLQTHTHTHTHTHARTHTHVWGNIYIYVRILNTKQSGTWKKWRVMSHTSMSHVAHMYWSCCTHKSSMSTHELDMSHTQWVMSHVSLLISWKIVKACDCCLYCFLDFHVRNRNFWPPIEFSYERDLCLTSFRNLQIIFLGQIQCEKMPFACGKRPPKIPWTWKATYSRWKTS